MAFLLLEAILRLFRTIRQGICALTLYLNYNIYINSVKHLALDLKDVRRRTSYSLKGADAPFKLL